jgi:leucyl aminopeptidase (aminopeptidase T)
MNKLEKAAQVVINRSLELKRQESLLILCDEPHLEIAENLFQFAVKKSKHIHLLRLNDDYMDKNLLCDSVAHFMQTMNAVIAITRNSISHLDSRREACRKGVRFITMPGITNDTFCRIAQMDFERVGRLSRKMKDILTIAKEAKISAPNGTHLTLSLASRKGFADTGLVNTPGAFSNLPAGEASIAPEENGVEGDLVVDSGMGVAPEDRDPLCLTFKDGKVSRISGGECAERLRRILAPYGANARKAAEFGIGANEAARISGYSLEDEKVLGTIHFAVGNNLSFGGNNPVAIHLDGVVYKASVAIDGRKILDNGKLLLE